MRNEEERKERTEWPEDKRTKLVHFGVECLMCSESLHAETNKLVPLVVLVQTHLKTEHDESKSGKEILQDKRFQWSTSRGIPFDLLERQTVDQAKEARNLPPIKEIILV